MWTSCCCLLGLAEQPTVRLVIDPLPECLDQKKKWSKLTKNKKKFVTIFCLSAHTVPRVCLDAHKCRACIEVFVVRPDGTFKLGSLQQIQLCRRVVEHVIRTPRKCHYFSVKTKIASLLRFQVLKVPSGSPPSPKKKSLDFSVPSFHLAWVTVESLTHVHMHVGKKKEILI